MTSVPFITAFSPTSVGSLALWLDGTDPAGTGTAPSIGATVSTWVDKSTSAKNATAGGTPTYVAGGGVNFNGTSFFYNLSFAQNLSQRSIFIVMQETTHTGTKGVFPLIPNPSTGQDWLTTTGMTIETSNGLRFYGNTGQYSSDIGNATLLVKAIYNDNMNTRAGSGFLNGTNATNITATYTAGTCSGYGVGARWPGSTSMNSGLDGVIFEIMFFNSPLSLSNRQNVEGYLSQKWGLTASLPVGHPGLTQTFFSATPSLRSLGGLTSTLTITSIPYYTTFNPINLGNLALWLDASQDATANGVSIASLIDRSGNGNSLTPSGTITAATNFLRGRTVYNFGSSRASKTNFPWQTSFTQIVLVKCNTGNWLSSLVSGGAYLAYIFAGNDNLINVNNFFNPTDSSKAVGTSVFTYAADGVSSWIIFSIGYQSNATTASNYTINGTVRTSATSTAVSSAISATNQLWLNGNGSSTFDSGTYVAEMMHYNAVLSETQRQQVESYLAQKWGLLPVLPVGHLQDTAPAGMPTSILTKNITNPKPIYGSVIFTYLPVSPYSGNQYLSASVTAPSTDSVTYECWFYQTTQNSGNNAIFSTRTGGEGNGGIVVGINSYWGGFSLGTPTFLANYGFAPSLNTWHHIALVRNGTSAWTFYYDGIAKTSDQGATFTFTSTTSTDIYIGAFASSGYPQQFTGYVTNFRYVKGVAVYTGNFTVPTTALTVTQSSGTNISAITAGQTQLLLLQENTGLLTDTANNTTVTNTGTATWNALTPF